MTNRPPDGADGAAANLQQVAREVVRDWVKEGAAVPDAPTPPPPAPPAAPPVVAAPPAAEAPPPAPPPAATATQVADFIEALIGEGDDVAKLEKVKIPLTARVPLDVNGQVIYRPFKDVREGGMRLEDYHGKTMELAEQRRELESHAANLIADQARLAAREQFIEEQNAILREAQKSPEKWERYQEHLARLESDEEYRKTFEDALEARERRAAEAAEVGISHQQQVDEGVSAVAGWMLELGEDKKFANVDLDRVRDIYAADLREGRAKLDKNEVKAIFEREAQLAPKPETSEAARVTALEAQVAALVSQRTATDAAAAHNAATEHAVQRGQRTVPVNTGQPAAPSSADKKVKPFTPRELPDVNREWAARRD